MLCYIDPVSGSLILQAFIAALVGGFVFFRKSLSAIASRLLFFLRRRPRNPD